MYPKLLCIGISFPALAGRCLPGNDPRVAATEQDVGVPKGKRPPPQRVTALEIPCRGMRALVVSNMKPTSQAPQRGSFVRDQVVALRRLGVDVTTFDWEPGTSRHPRALASLRALLRREAHDVVHAHYGLAGWVARAAGADPLVVTFHGTDVRHPIVGAMSRRLARREILVATASRSLFAAEGGRPGLPAPLGRAAVLPCGADLERFRPVESRRARRELGLAEAGRYLLFPASPTRQVKRFDRAEAVATACGAELLTLGTVPPAEVPLWVNAASAVLITSEHEGFGLAAVEALACDRPVLSTPVGAVPALAGGIDGCLVADFDAEVFAAAAERHLTAAGPRVMGRRRALAFGAGRAAERVLAAYRDLTGIT
jgi:teichuronic acid biosynthesis glycosyltransferase TuaC